jgi:hypothetical protein
VNVEENVLREMASTIADLTRSTRDGGMSWIEANKTTFVWTNPKNGSRLVLQKTAEPPRLIKGVLSKMPAYQFQAVEGQTKQAGLTVETDEVPQLFGPVNELYEAVQTSVAKKGLSFLKSILPPN